MKKILIFGALVFCQGGFTVPELLGEKKAQTGEDNLYPIAPLRTNDRDSISGRCVVESDIPTTMELTIPNVEVLLLSPEGRVLERTGTSGGKFSFAIKDRKK